MLEDPNDINHAVFKWIDKKKLYLHVPQMHTEYLLCVLLDYLVNGHSCFIVNCRGVFATVRWQDGRKCVSEVLS